MKMESDKQITKNIWEKFLEVTESKKKLDPVGGEDGDIDNDGDKDSSDEYLSNRRKAISKSMKKEGCGKMRKEEKVECPKCEGKGCSHCDDTGYHMKEEVEQDWLNSLAAELDRINLVLENDYEKHTKGATQPEELLSKESPKSKEFVDQHKKSDKEMEDKEEKGHDDVTRAGRAVKSQSPSRRADNLNNGDGKSPEKPKKM